MEWIPNQPIFFGTANACNDDELVVNQLVDNTDISQVQFRIAPCDDAVQLLTDPTFENSVNTATIVDCDNIVAGASWIFLAGGNNFHQDNVFDNYETQYCITVVVTTYVGAISVYFGTNLVATITSAGTHTVSGNALDNYTLLFNFPKNTVITSVCPCVDDEWTFDSNWTISQGSLCSVGVSAATATSTYSFDLTKYYQITFVVDSISAGGSLLVYLGDSYLGEITSIGTYTFYGLPVTTGELTLTPSTGTEICFSSITSYEINTNLILSVYNSANAYQTQITYTSNSGYFHFAEDTVTIDIDWSALNISNGCFYLRMYDPCSAAYEYLESNTFEIADYTNKCTILINACNNEDGLGFVFQNSSFSPRLRVESKLRQAKYKTERNIYEDSLGTKKNYYFSGRKQKNLCIDLQPEYVHDFLRLLAGFDNVYLDSAVYFVEDDEYNVLYNEASDELGSVRILVSEKTQNVKNINTSDSETNCNLAQVQSGTYRTISNGNIRTLSDNTSRTLS